MLPKYLLAAGVILFSSFAVAKPAPPLKNIEVYGKVTLNGQPIEGVPVEFRTGSCFAEPDGKVKTNKHGFYYIKLATFFHAGGGLRVKVPASTPRSLAYAPYCQFEPVAIEYKSNQKVRYNVILQKAQPISQDEVQCLAKGGQWGPLTKDKTGCNFTYKDYAQSCTDGSQCLGKVCLPSRWVSNQGVCPLDTLQALNTESVMKKGKRVLGRAN